jgi:hypothetical protein
LLAAGHFVLSAELTPPRHHNLRPLMAIADRLEAYMDVLQINDNALAQARLSNLVAAQFVWHAGIEPVVQMTLRHRNRIALQSDLLGLAALGIRNLIVVGGYPCSRGSDPQAKDAQDMSTIEAIAAINNLTERGCMFNGEKIMLTPDFFMGTVAFTEVKSEDLEASLDHLEAKINCGAKFVQLQATFDLKSLQQCTNRGTEEISYVETGENFYNAGMFNYSAALLARKYNFPGHCTSLSTGCTAGLDALGLSFELIQSGEMSVMMSGATEAPLTSLTYATLDVIGSLSVADCEPAKSSRPFDAKRGGFVIGEAAAVLVLEELDHALARGAHIYAEVVSYSSVSNAFHMTDLPDHGIPMAAVVRKVMESGKVAPEELDYINAHGSSTPQNDVFETNAYKTVLGAQAYQVPIILNPICKKY